MKTAAVKKKKVQEYWNNNKDTEPPVGFKTWIEFYERLSCASDDDCDLSRDAWITFTVTKGDGKGNILFEKEYNYDLRELKEKVLRELILSRKQ